MAFCIRESEYDPEIHDIVSGPHKECDLCFPAPSFISGSYYEISPLLGNDLFFIEIKDEVANRNINSLSEDDIYFYGSLKIGQKSYNNVWGFYIDEIGLIPEGEIDSTNKDIPPSEITQRISSGELGDGSLMYFKLSGRLRKMRITGVFGCEYPLDWTPNLIVDDGEFLQNATCEGDCSEIYDDETYQFCMDYIDDELLRIIDEYDSSYTESEFPDIYETSYILSLSEEEFQEYELQEDMFSIWSQIYG